MPYDGCLERGERFKVRRRIPYTFYIEVEVASEGNGKHIAEL